MEKKLERFIHLIFSTTIRKLLVLFFYFFTATGVFAADADFSWLPNSETSLAGYKIYYGTVSGQYDQVLDVGSPGVVSGTVQATVSGLTGGVTYYFAATAYDSDGFESDFSQEVVWTAPGTPPPAGAPIDEPPGTVTGVAVE